MRSLNLIASITEFTLLFHDRKRVGSIHLGNEISAAIDRAAKKLKLYSWNCLVDVTKSVLALDKAIYDQSHAGAIRFFLVVHRSR